MAPKQIFTCYWSTWHQKNLLLYLVRQIASVWVTSFIKHNEWNLSLRDINWQFSNHLPSKVLYSWQHLHSSTAAKIWQQFPTAFHCRFPSFLVPQNFLGEQFSPFPIEEFKYLVHLLFLQIAAINVFYGKIKTPIRAVTSQVSSIPWNSFVKATTVGVYNPI